MDTMRLQAISEVSYLTADNAWRYRAILRYFYEQHERMRHYLFAEEVYAHLREHEAFQTYTEEQLQQDLEALVRWKNLIARQETGKVRTIEEFKKKKYRYQCTPYTVEIERMVQTLERLGDSFGGSLERTLFDRLFAALQQLVRVIDKTKPLEERDRPALEECYRHWEDVFGYFRQLTENATDYIAYLKSEKVEDRMMTEAFLAYKEAFTEYLRDFIMALQRTSMNIETVIEKLTEKDVARFTELLGEYQERIPRLEDNPKSKAQWAAEFRKQWESFREWFLGSEARESDLVFLQNETNETIRKITRFVQRLGERHHHFRSRYKDYLHLAEWFAGIDDLKEAHRLSACVFGVANTRHLFCDPQDTEDIYREVWEEPASVHTLKPRVRRFREKSRPNAVEEKNREKQEMLRQHLLEREAQAKLIQALMDGDEIVVKRLPVVDPYVRKTVLRWIGLAMGQADRTIKTEWGHVIQVNVASEEEVVLRSEDGDLAMPDFVLKFLGQPIGG